MPAFGDALSQEELLSIWRRSPKTVVFVTHDVREAVLLADRVAVMTARPGRIKRIVDTRFDRSNLDALSKDAGFLDRVDGIWQLVREEALAAEADASRSIG